MHLASHFLDACLKNAVAGTRNEVSGAIRKAVREVLGPTTGTEVLRRGVDEHVLRANQHCNSADADYVLFTEQALRLAALFHDIGHLPYSHDFEYAIEDLEAAPEGNASKDLIRPLLEQEAGRTKIHERLGYNIALLLLRELSASGAAANTGLALDFLFNLAFRILVAVPTLDPTPAEAAIQWLHSLMSGDLDVDRCDYLLRDGRNYGFEFAGYNLPRLLDNLVVTEKEKAFVTAIRPQGLGAVESYLLSRFRSYQYGVRHHKVAQVGVALRHSILEILQDSGNSQIGDYLSLLGKISQIRPEAEIDSI